jgi:hypothetical protein
MDVAEVKSGLGFGAAEERRRRLIDKAGALLACFCDAFSNEATQPASLRRSPRIVLYLSPQFSCYLDLLLQYGVQTRDAGGG